MKPITREEYYLAKIAGTWQGKTPEPVTIEEYYLATMAGDYSGNTPQPVTRLQYYMAKAAGVWGGSIPAPVTRLEYYWAAIAGKEGHIPDPVTRQEYLLYAISQSNNDVINTVFGATIIINDAAEGRPFRGLRVFGKSTQDGMPSVENPVPIVNAGEGGNIKFSVTDGSNVWFSIDAGQTRVCRSIGSKDIKGFYDLLSPDDGLEYMFAVGDIKTYTPYVEPQSLTLQTPNGLPGVPVSKDGNYTDSNGQQWVCDEIDLERGKYVQRIETRIFDGTEAWKHSITNSGNNNFQLRINDRPSSTLHQSFCNYLPYKNFIWDDDIVNLPKIYSYSLEITASFPPESEFKFVEIWNSWLKEKGDFKFQYVLATPIERDLTPEEIAAYKALRTYGPTTVITNDAGAGMEVTYVAER